jgi:hypothetical protein
MEGWKGKTLIEVLNNFGFGMIFFNESTIINNVYK